MNESPAICLASGDAAADLLQAYDAANKSWAFPQVGDFWEAVAAAHGRGRRGARRRIAIVDTACDLTLPPLAHGTRHTGGRAVMPSAAGEPTEHGTVVALLVATVAPEADLDIYEITQDGVPDIRRVAEAFERIGRSEADIVCLSFGMVQPHHLDARMAWIEKHSASAEGLLPSMVACGGWPKPEVGHCLAEICLCEAVNALHRSGKCVLAAVGNDAGQAFCPASAAGAIAVGFQLDRRERVGLREAAWSAAPGYAQSQFTEITLMQPDGVLGSSFATPLMAGALALGVEVRDLRALLVSAQIGALADSMMVDWYQAYERGRDAELEERLLRTYYIAITAHPYYRSRAPDALFASALIGISFFINAGLFFLGTQELELARKLLSWVREVVPGNCHAAANLGKTLFQMALHSASGPESDLAHEASALYATALRLRPGFEPYLNEKARIDEYIEKRERQP